MEENNLKESFGTLLETKNGLNKLGYLNYFNVKNECIVNNSNSVKLSPDDFQIDKVYRFKDAAESYYKSILYAVSSIKNKVKGFLVNGYGVFSDEATSKLVEKLNTNTAIKTKERLNQLRIINNELRMFLRWKRGK